MGISNPIQVGDSVSETRTFTEAEVRTFATVSHDVNPIHVDAAYAATTRFGQRIVHGMFVGSMFSALIANQLPGNGTIYLEQSLAFKKPVFFDKPITATVSVKEVVKPGLYRLTTVAKDEAGEVVIEGEALVLNREKRG